MTPTGFLTAIVFAPAIATIGLALIPKQKHELIRTATLVVTVAVMLATLWIAACGGSPLQFDLSTSEMQSTFNHAWIPSFDIGYFMGFDGISFPLVLLTSVISVFAMLASWSIKKYVKAYCILFLLLETGMLGVFMALDFFLFYVFWEVMLLPMYFLIGIWGGPRKEYAALKFFLYTLVGSVFMLIAILMLYFNSDLTRLSPDQLVASHVVSVEAGADAGAAAEALLNEIAAGTRSTHTFNILAMQQMGQSTDLFDKELAFGWSLQRWAFALLFLGFVIKVPSVPVHTWLPDAHVEAPTPISMILAGVLLKMGGYGIIRICYPICPEAGFAFAWVVCFIGVASMVWGALAALAQTDFKRLVAYSSVSHMGYVVLGLGVWTLAADPNLIYTTEGWSDYWNMGVKGAMFQMIGHGVSSAGMFFMVGVIYDRVHHRNLAEFGGLYGRMPLYTALAMGLFFAGLGLPGLCGFIGEVFVVLSVWNFSKCLAVVSAGVVILTAGYILWAIQRVYLGPEYRGPHGDEICPINFRELCVAVPLFVLAIVLGVFPQQTILKYMDATIDQQITDLADWSEKKVIADAKTGESPDDVHATARLPMGQTDSQTRAVFTPTPSRVSGDDQVAVHQGI